MVSSVASTGSGTLAGLASGGSTGIADVNFDTFLKLLVTQLQNQDPLNPMDGTQFTSQIAQFSQLEQTVKSNSLLEKLSKTQDYSLQGLAIGSIGKEVLMPGSAGQLVDGKMDFGYKLGEIAGRVDVEVVDASGRTIRTFEADGAEGPHSISWDGTDDDGNLQPDGPYSLRISAADFEGTKIPVDIYTYGVVTEVTNDGSGGVSVGTVDGRTASFDDVLSIRAFQG